ncbi:MAG: aspartate carbamoyltransferase catalytic subunit [Deltaproteobacteria bacterium]|nr:aspartate carbamoyltransferase catalytic subunit [Deltaproteobacteria bacterium]
MLFQRPHLLGLEGLTADELTFLLDTAESFKEVSEREIKKVPALRGRTVVNLFFEPSTRTRISFEIAAKRLSADTVSLSTQASSASKGETLADTARNLAAMRPDAIVVRHPSSGAPDLLARHVDCPIINAGDGAHEHPTQALLDLLTIREHKGRIEGLTVAIVGDLLHSRVGRSNLHGLRTMGARVRFVGPPTLVSPHFAELGAELVHDLHEGVRDADVIMMLRIQRERMTGRYFSSLNEYSRLYCLSADAVAKAKEDVIILHPGPMNRGVEISSTVADGPYSVIMDQVTNGVAVRMATLFVLVGRRRSGKDKDEASDAEESGAMEQPEAVLLRRAATGE